MLGLNLVRPLFALVLRSMGSRREAVWRGAPGRLVLGQLVLAGSLKLLVLQPEHCPPPSAPELDGAITAAVGWFAANAGSDGRFLYRYRPATDTVEPGSNGAGYNIVRHAGALVALEQASAAGWHSALLPAEAGWRFVEDHLVDVAGPGSAFVLGAGLADTGAAALSAVAWTMRLQRDPAFRSKDPEPPPELLALGAFLVGQVEPSGAVAAFRDRRDGRPQPTRSRFYTGEAAWALQRLARVLPDRGFEEPADRTLRYLVQDRDRMERWFPPIADHWAAYALAEATERGVRRVDDSGYRAVIAGRFAVQVRWESQRRIGSTFSALTRARPAVGAALGTLGEGLGQLALSDPARSGAGNGDVERVRGLRRQVACVSGMLVERQVTANDAATVAPPRPGGGGLGHGRGHPG